MAWKANPEIYDEMTEKSVHLSLFDFMTDKALVKMLVDDYLRHVEHCNVENAADTDEVLDHCYIKLARFWLIKHGLVRDEIRTPKSDVRAKLKEHKMKVKELKAKLMQAIMFVSFSATIDINKFTLADFETANIDDLYGYGCVPEQTLPQAYNHLTGVEEGLL